MISASAKDGFDYILTTAMRSTLGGAQADAMALEMVEALPIGADRQMAAITISSYLFRLMVFIRFADDLPTRQRMAESSRKALDDFDDQAFLDAMCESANMACGAMSRELSKLVPHIGMSTPNILGSQCAAYLPMLHCGHIRHFDVRVGGESVFGVSLCVSEYADLDFAVEVSAEEEVTGELEMF